MKNTGAGFPSAARERGFQPSAKTAAPVEKAGTGLALVGQLVLLMQGQMQVNSQPGSGSVYRVILPLDRLITVR
jgi:signal transduction histidine kinase